MTLAILALILAALIGLLAYVIATRKSRGEYD